MLIVLMAGVALWVVYGVIRHDVPIIATNCFSLLVNIAMIVLRIKYKCGQAEKSKTADSRQRDGEVSEVAV